MALGFLHLSWIVLFLYPKKEISCDNFPDLSIVIPAHYEEKYIADTVGSVLNAEYPGRKEVIVVNDGSVDRTEDIVKEISERDGRVRLYETNHAGKNPVGS